MRQTVKIEGIAKKRRGFCFDHGHQLSPSKIIKWRGCKNLSKGYKWIHL
jgi:hypothetical protein